MIWLARLCVSVLAGALIGVSAVLAAPRAEAPADGVGANLQKGAVLSLPEVPHPLILPALVTEGFNDHPEPVAVAVAVQEWPDQLTEEQAIAVLREAGWPEEWIGDALVVAWCESKYSPAAVGDSGASLGWFQLWTGWWPAAGEDIMGWDNPVNNARVALYVRQERGRFGGSGGWTCADLEGIW